MGALHVWTFIPAILVGTKMEFTISTNLNQDGKEARVEVERCSSALGMRPKSTSPRSLLVKDITRSTESLTPAAPGSPEAMETGAFRSSIKRNRDMIRTFKAGSASAHRKYSSTSEEGGSIAKGDWGQAKTPILAKRLLRQHSPAPSSGSDVVMPAAAADTANVIEVASDDDGEYASLSDSSAKRLRSDSKRGRGRPESTGEYRIKKAMAVEKEIRKEVEDLEAVLDPEVDPKALRLRKRLDKETEQLVEQWRLPQHLI